MIGFNDDVYSMLATAVQQQIPVWLVYDGQRRLVCPHSLGTNRKGGTNLLAYQIDGESSSGIGGPGSPGNWRCLRVSKISEVEFCPFAPWATAGNHSCANNCVVNVDVEVS